MAKHNQKGRSKGERHLRLTHFMMGTPAWLSLPPAERAVYIFVAGRYNGGNNGSIAASVRDVADNCHINKDTATKALRTLEERGFIVRVTPGSFNRKTPHAAEWRLTEWSCDKTRTVATKAYQHWRAPPQPMLPQSKTRSGSRGQTVRNGGTVTPLQPGTVP